MTVRAVAYLSVSVLTLAIASPALAQASVSPSTNTQTNDLPTAEPRQVPIENDAPVGDIIVTAQRRSESLQRVPVSVNVVTADILRDRNLNDLQQITLAAPSLQLGQENSFSIRGVGTLAFQQTVDPAVAISLDEVSLARTLLSESLFDDVAQVEVLNGPQGLLFGRNASAGLLNITTVRPTFDKMSMDGNIEYDYRDTTPGNGDGVITRVNLNMPITGNSALRLNVGYQYQKPVVRDVVSGTGSDTDRRSVEARGKYLFKPTNALEIYLIGNYSQTTGTAGAYDRTYRSLAPNSANAAPLAADGYVAGPNLLEYKADGTNQRSLKSYGGQARVSYAFDNGWELINLAAYKGYKHSYAFDQDFTTSNGASLSALDSRFHQFSNELRVALPSDGKLTGQVGLYYLTFLDRTSTQTGGNLYIPGFVLPSFPFCVGATPTVGAPPPSCSVSNDYAIGGDANVRFKSDSYAAFGQFTYELAPGLRLLAGGRVTRDEIDVTATQNRLNYFVRFGGPPGTYAQSAGNTNFSWKAGGQYEPNSQLLFYGNYATGYKGPGANNGSSTATSDLIVQPETSRNIELGAKTSWFDRRLTFNVSAFQTKYKNYQAAAFNSQQASFIVTNAAELTSKGIELTTSIRPFRGLSLNGAVTLLDAKFDDFPGAQCYPQQPGCSTSGTFNAKGLRTPLAAKFTSTIGAGYRTPLTDDVALTLNGDWYHRSSVNYTVSTNPLTALGPIDVFGGRIGLDLNEQVQVSIFCKNCTDKRVPTFVYSDPGDAAAGLNSSVQTFGFNSVRTIGAALGFRF